MNKESKGIELAKNTILFAISSFGSQALSFFFVPLYTNILSTADYGNVDMIITISSLAAYVFTLNIHNSIINFCINNKRKINILNANIEITLIGSIAFLVFELINLLFNIIHFEPYYYVFTFLILLFSSIYNIFANYLKIIDEVKAVAISGVIQTLSMILSNIILLVIYDAGVYGYLISVVMSYVSPIVYMVFVLYKTNNIRIRERATIEETKKLLRYSIPLVLNSVAWWVNESLDKLFIKNICGIDESGIYSLASRIPSLLSVFVTIFLYAWQLSSIKSFDKNDSDNFISSTYKLYTMFLIVCSSLLITINKPLSKFLLQKDFFEAWKYSQILIIASLFNNLSSFVGNIFTACKDSKNIALSSIMSAAINIFLDVILINRFNTIGGPISTAISFFAMFLFRYIKSHNHMVWHVKHLKNAICVIILILQIILCNESLIYQLLLNLAIISIYFVEIKELLCYFYTICLNLLHKSK